MPELPTARQVMYISRDSRCLAVVENPETQPWRVVREPAREGSKALPWEVVMFLPSYLQPDTLVFATHRDAVAWIDEPDDSSSNDADVERSNEATARFDEFAKRHDLDPNSPEALERAHEEGIVGSACLFELNGCQGRHQLVDGYLADWATLGKDWKPKSCRAKVRATLYADTDGWKKNGIQTGVVGDECRPDFPHEVKSVKAEN
jgi:hypothetical protein